MVGIICHTEWKFVLHYGNLMKTNSLVAQLVKNLLAMWEIWVQSLGWEDPLEKRKAAPCSTVAWRIHGVAESRTHWVTFSFMAILSSKNIVLKKCETFRNLKSNWNFKTRKIYIHALLKDSTYLKLQTKKKNVVFSVGCIFKWIGHDTTF